MLSTIRNGLNSVFVLILMGLLIASFAIFGTTDIFARRTPTIATVGGQDIDANDLIRQYQNRVASFQAQYGPSFTDQQAIAFGVHQQVLGEMIGAAIVLERSDD